MCSRSPAGGGHGDRDPQFAILVNALTGGWMNAFNIIINFMHLRFTVYVYNC